MNTCSMSASVIVLGWPSTSATALVANDSSSGVYLYSSAKTDSGLKPFLTLMTKRSPCSRSVRFVTAEMPLILPELTLSLMRSMTRSGPTMYGSSVTTMPIFRAETRSIVAFARTLKIPRPVSYDSFTAARPGMMPPPGKSGPGTKRIRSSVVAWGFLSR